MPTFPRRRLSSGTDSWAGSIGASAWSSPSVLSLGALASLIFSGWLAGSVHRHSGQRSAGSRRYPSPLRPRTCRDHLRIRPHPAPSGCHPVLRLVSLLVLLLPARCCRLIMADWYRSERDRTVQEHRGAAPDGRAGHMSLTHSDWGPVGLSASRARVGTLCVLGVLGQAGRQVSAVAALPRGRRRHFRDDSS